MVEKWAKVAILFVFLGFVVAESLVVVNALAKSSAACNRCLNKPTAACRCVPPPGLNTGAVIGEVR